MVVVISLSGSFPIGFTSLLGSFPTLYIKVINSIAISSTVDISSVAGQMSATIFVFRG